MSQFTKRLASVTAAKVDILINVKDTGPSQNSVWEF